MYALYVIFLDLATAESLKYRSEIPTIETEKIQDGNKDLNELVPFSHIMVYDGRSVKVHILDSDGRFLSHLRTGLEEINKPRSLSYDVNTHSIWVGSRWDNKVCVYTDQQDSEILNK